MSEKRFARQHIYRPPPAFPPASSCTGIVHHLSGPSGCAHAQTFHKSSWLADGAGLRRPTFYFHFASWVFHPPTRALARLLGPCFKTGRWTGFSWYPVRAAPRRGKATDQPRHPRPQCSAPQQSIVRPRAPVPASTQCRQQLLRTTSTRAHATRPSLPATQFHALFYSLASGLFIVPSRYFFAIGLPLVFSLRWGLPPN